MVVSVDNGLQERPPWLQTKVWITVLGMIALAALDITGAMETEPEHYIWLAGLGVLGRAWEGGMAALRDGVAAIGVIKRDT